MLIGLIAAVLVVWFLWTLSDRDHDATREARQRFAEATGLKSETLHPLLGGQTVVSGVYREHPVELYTRTYGKGLVPATRLTVTVRDTAGLTLQLRGPFNRDTRSADAVTDELFQASDAVVVGQTSQFYARSNRPEVLAGLRANELLWRRLDELTDLCTIEVHGPHLVFEQLGAVHDVAYLRVVADVMTHLAAELDRDGFQRRRA